MPATMKYLIVVSLGLAAGTRAFRPPAIPLITTDPYFQSFIMGDNSTDGAVKHWDQRDKELVGLIRIDGEAYRFLGAYAHGVVTVEPAEVHHNKYVAPGSCDISHLNIDEVGCSKHCHRKTTCLAFVMRENTCYLKSCLKPLAHTPNAVSVIVRRPAEMQALKQVSVEVLPTRTIFRLRDPKFRVELNVTFLSTLFTDDYDRLSRPVSYMIFDMRSLSGSEHAVQLCVDATAQWAVNADDELVNWEYVDDIAGARLGTYAQNVLGAKGDKTNINWGYLYFAPAQQSSASFRSWAGSAQSVRSSFVSAGVMPSIRDQRMPRRCGDDLPTLALVGSLVKVGGASERQVALLAYDDVKSVKYYDEGSFCGFWTRTWSDIRLAMKSAGGEVFAMMQKSETHDDDLMQKLASVGGQQYAIICALAYRQTLAATKLVWNTKRGEMWNFLKEISTNGDMQTMDVVFPSSPLFIYTRPELLKRLLIPVLSFANNETSMPFYHPFSPHEIGTYPIADHNTAQQEPMPMENTGNMFLMIAGIIKADVAHDASFIYPRYWPLLTNWADYLKSTLPFPANQLCTDDFTGKLANNTNLAAKGIIALEAFAEICEAAMAGDCEQYRTAARGFAKTWKDYAWELDHFKIAYNFSNSFSIKYNIVWQKLLDMDGPFEWKDVVPLEMKYYQSKANAFGTPMDSRHTYTKLDWLSWGAAMADDDQSFHALQDPIYKMAHASPTRVPLTDLYDTITATASRGTQSFVDRPVVGGVYAKMLRAMVEERASAARSLIIFM